MRSQVLGSEQDFKHTPSFENQIAETTYALQLQLSQYDGFGNGERALRPRLEHLYEIRFLGQGKERIRPALNSRVDASASIWTIAG